jgi:hypothetical protein
MSDGHALMLRQMYQTCGELRGIAAELAVIKAQMARLRSRRAYLKRAALIVPASICAIAGAVVPLLMR